ncbi:uteroglobin [Dromiciops gliroides]|uniref:uteroglobin n=1 Tax=Dromiciops gliroides TaxID=33562 RepID=UPI001CC602B4|nr:uteroglobin [Dromiciops gliroides]
MKLTLVFSLVALTLCCTRASANLCPSFVQVTDILFKGTAQQYLKSIRCFQPDEAMEAAAKLLKKKVDTLSDATKRDMGRLMEKIVNRSCCP